MRGIYIDLQAAYVISDIGVLGDDLGEFADSLSQTFWNNGRVVTVVAKGYVGKYVAFGEFGEGRVALGASFEGVKV